MKTFNFGEGAKKGALEPSVAGALSLVPGLGQFYNGDRLKGWLFLEVGAINFIIILSILCADSISKGILAFADSHQFAANVALVKQLGSFKLGHPGATLLFALCLSFIAFSVRDAYDRALNIKNREIYAGHFLELSEATSGSYLAHFALMGALLLLSCFLLIPAPPRTQVTEIEFISRTDKDQRIKPKTHVISTVNVKPEGIHRPRPVQTNQGQTTPSQPASSSSHREQTQVQKPLPKPENKTDAQSAPKPAPLKLHETPKPPAPVTAPLPAVHPPAPAPLAAQPARVIPTAVQPRPVANASSAMSALPLPKPMAATTTQGATFLHPDSAPVPVTVGAGAFTPKPLLAMNTAGRAGNPVLSVATSPIGMASVARPSNSNQSWMSGKSPTGAKSGTAPAAPTIDASSFNGTGDKHAKPTIIDGTSGRTGSGKSTSEGPKPTAAKSGPGPGDVIAVIPHVLGPKGDPTGGISNPDPSTTGVGKPTAGSTEHPMPKFGEYMAALQRRIRRAWYPPRQPNSKSTMIVFTIGVNGELLSTHLQRSSGEAAMDDAAMQAIRNSAPFPHLPQHADEPIDVQFTFDYNVFGGGGLRQF